MCHNNKFVTLIYSLIAMDTNLNSRAFPKSINNKQCIGPCYNPGQYIMHPITLEYVTDELNPFCPTERWFNPVKKTYQRLDRCLLPTKKEDMDKMQIELSFVIPTFHFDCEHFLKVYYDIYSFEGAIDWVTENIKNPIYSNLRIMDCAWKIYGSNVDVISNQLIDFYIYVIKKEWIKNIYPLVSKYIYIDSSNNIYLKEQDEPSHIKQVEKINYFIKKFINRQTIYNILYSYIEDNKSNWFEIKNHNNLIEEFTIKLILDKINKTLKNHKDE